jgi:hypothetical protein
MKKLQEKFLPLISILKGKKPMVIVVSLVVIGLSLLGVKYGYITEDMVDFHLIINQVDGIFVSSTKDSVVLPVDTLVNVVDTLSVSVDSLSN